ncbi:MAG: hypothetical protein PPFGHCPK_01397 (plasmid) [Spiroplasma endosymbiont of Drosophila atripex]|nr:MAG: hypothetical protein PPFGHCPK_01397 [Spiroplasma endosymbiont of Drosophila atripex]
MSEEKKDKKKKKAAIIAAIVGSAALLTGAVDDKIAACSNETEINVQEEKEEKNRKNKKANKNRTNIDKKQDLKTALSQAQRNLGTIATNGDILTADMIKVKLPTNIQNEVDIKIQQGNKAILTAKTSSTLYKGSPIIVNFNFDKKQDLAMSLTKTNLSTIFENPLLLIHIFFGIIGFSIFCISLILILLNILP